MWDTKACTELNLAHSSERSILIVFYQKAYLVLRTGNHSVVGAMTSSSCEASSRKPSKSVFEAQSYIQDRAVAVRSFKEHANKKSGMHSGSKILYNSFLDQYKGREVPVNKMADSNYKKNCQKIQRDNCSYS